MRYSDGLDPDAPKPHPPLAGVSGPATQSVYVWVACASCTLEFQEQDRYSKTRSWHQNLGLWDFVRFLFWSGHLDRVARGRRLGHSPPLESLSLARLKHVEGAALATLGARLAPSEAFS